MSAVEAYAKLVARGCLCGAVEKSSSCPLHVAPGDNRGLRAYYKAGMPGGFPMVANCVICGSEGLMYPDVELDDAGRKSDGPPPHRPTLICPSCSKPVAERALRGEVEAAGRYALNGRSVFGSAAA